MLTHQSVGHASNPAVIREIIDRIADALADAKLNVRMCDYQETIKVDERREFTGHRTITIEIGRGDRDVEIGYSPSDCCGG